MEGINYLKLNNSSAYRISFNLSNYVWRIIIHWNFFEKDTVGKQFTRAIDSISANIAEGFGRYGKKDKVKFYRYSYGSIKEFLDWNEKFRVRNLLNDKEYTFIFCELDKLPEEINSFIKFTNLKLTI